MCDPIKTAPGTGWRGWNTKDTSRPAKAAGEWSDLTWPLSPSASRISSFPPPRIERIASIPEMPFLPRNVVGGDGAPARVLGRALGD